MTRICIFGAGAIGGMIAAQLARAGEAEVSLVARGPHLAAIQANGLTLKKSGETFTVHPRAAADARELGVQDYVILTIKTHGVAAAADALMPLLGPDTAILFGQNGVPAWYFYRHGGAHDGHHLEMADPGGVIRNRLGLERAIGAVVWQSAEIEAPGIIAQSYGNRMPVGEPSGEKTQRVETLSRLLMNAGIKSPVRSNLRNEVWLKLAGNLSFNPVSILTTGTLSGITTDPGTRRVLHTMIEEARAVAAALGAELAVSATEQIDMAAKVGAHRTSMLQDLDAGRPTELDAMLGAVIELGQLTNLATPALQLVYDLAKFRTRA